MAKKETLVRKYRKRPVVIEAEQWFPGVVHPAVEEHDHFGPHIHTLEGVHYVTASDFIIRGVKGEFYPCKADIFALTYEEVE
jgi:hypothetical protein